jgi:hypothetical protein
MTQAARFPRLLCTTQSYTFPVNAFERIFGSRDCSSSSSAREGSSSGSKEQGSGKANGNGQQSHEDDWTEVIDKGTGQTYYWNQRTGETTSLGEDKPVFGSERFQDAQETAESAAPGVRFREVPEKDQTFKYTLYGIFVGVFSGWVSQFL